MGPHENDREYEEVQPLQSDPQPRSQYTRDEVQQAIEAIKLLLRWRNEDRAKGLIDW